MQTLITCFLKKKIFEYIKPVNQTQLRPPVKNRFQTSKFTDANNYFKKNVFLKISQEKLEIHNSLKHTQDC